MTRNKAKNKEIEELRVLETRKRDIERRITSHHLSTIHQDASKQKKKQKTHKETPKAKK